MALVSTGFLTTRLVCAGTSWLGQVGHALVSASAGRPVHNDYHTSSFCRKNLGVPAPNATSRHVPQYSAKRFESSLDRVGNGLFFALGFV